MLSVIIPAYNEEAVIARCIESVLAQSITSETAGGLEMIVAANGCRDRTVSIAESYAHSAKDAGWTLTVLDIERGSKTNAWNEGEAAATGDIRIYLDADIVLDAEVFDQLFRVLNVDLPRYASGTMVVVEAESWVTRRFMALWRKVPYNTVSGVQGAGLFATNAPGRARWDIFPDVLADDHFVRLQFAADERFGVPARFFWPPAEGFATLVKVRRRQDAGNAQLEEMFPEIMANESKPEMRLVDHARLFLGGPLDYVIYVAVKLVVKFGAASNTTTWSRAR